MSLLLIAVAVLGLVAPAGAASRAVPPRLPRPAVPLRPAPAPAPALPAAAGPLAGATPAQAARPAELEAHEAGRAFDGAVPASGSPLAVADPAEAAWVAQVEAAARATPTGRRVLARVDRLAAERGRPVIVTVAPISNSGEFDYDWEVVTLDREHKRRAPEVAAPVLVHELIHVLQGALSLPVDALENEIEAFVGQFRTADELGGVVPSPFHRLARRAAARGADAFAAWLGRKYSKAASWRELGPRGYRDWLQDHRRNAHRRLDRLEKRLARNRAVLEQMEALGHPEPQRRVYKADAVDALEDKARRERLALGWIDRDLAALASPEERRRVSAHFREVGRRLRRYAASLENRSGRH